MRSSKASSLTVIVLTKLCRAYGAEVKKLHGAKTVSKNAYFVALLKVLFPGEDDATVSALLQRILTKASPEEAVLTTMAENAEEMLDHMSPDAKAEFKKDVELLSKTRSTKAIQKNAAPVNHTPASIKVLAPPGAYIIRVGSNRVYEGCHRKWNKHRWVARRWNGTRVQRSEVDALDEVVHWLWCRHKDAGFDVSARPTRGAVLAAWLVYRNPPAVPAVPAAAVAKPAAKPKAKGRAKGKAKAKAKAAA
jgi:hypothetical protein